MEVFDAHRNVYKTFYSESRVRGALLQNNEPGLSQLPLSIHRPCMPGFLWALDGTHVESIGSHMEMWLKSADLTAVRLQRWVISIGLYLVSLLMFIPLFHHYTTSFSEKGWHGMSRVQYVLLLRKTGLVIDLSKGHKMLCRPKEFFAWLALTCCL